MKQTFLLLILSMVFVDQLYATLDSDFNIDLSQENNYDITAEKLKDGDYLIKLPKTFNDVDLSSVGLIVGDEEVDVDSYLYVALNPYDNGEFLELFLTVGNDYIDSSQIIVQYSRPNILCIEAAFILRGLDKLSHSTHWREIDKKQLFKKTKQLKRGMSLSEVWKTLGRPHYESSPYPRSVEEVGENHVLKYVLFKGDADDGSKDQILNINFNKDVEFTDIKAINLDMDL